MGVFGLEEVKQNFILPTNTPIGVKRGGRESGTQPHLQRVVFDGVNAVRVLAGNPLRRSILLQNTSGAASMFFDYDQPATTGSFEIIPKGNYSESIPSSCPQGEIWAFCATAGAIMLASEGS